MIEDGFEKRRAEFYQSFLEDQEYESALWDRIQNATIEELAIFLTSPLEEERWVANWRIEQIKDQKKSR